jgi:ankyrin repeat protein
MQKLFQDNKLKPSQLFASSHDHAQQMILTYSTFGLLDKAKQLLADNKEDHTLINTQNYQGYTPLMLAIVSQNVAFIRFVLGYESVNMNSKTFIHQKTALIIACEHGDSVAVSSLLSGGAIVDDVDALHKTALMYACENRSVAAVQSLIQASANANKRDADGRTALMYALRGKPFNSLNKNNYIIIKELLHAGASIELRDNKGKSALDYCDKDERETIQRIFQDANEPIV